MPPSIEEKKNKIKGHYAKSTADKFTGISSAISTQKIKWKGEEVEFSLGGLLHELLLTISYHKLESEEAIKFGFNYINVDGGYVGMESLALLLLLDANQRIILDSVTQHDAQHRTKESAEHYNFMYQEVASLNIATSDFISLANSSRVDYRIKFGSGVLEGRFTPDQMAIIKGFYNNVFDSEFAVDFLYEEMKNERPEEKPSDKPAKKDGACFVATMAYGSYSHPQVMRLRIFRDETLSRSWAGRSFISLYYRYAPKLVVLLKNRTGVNRVIRKALDLFILTLRNEKPS